MFEVNHENKHVDESICHSAHLKNNEVPKVFTCFFLMLVSFFLVFMFVNLFSHYYDILM